MEQLFGGVLPQHANNESQEGDDLLASIGRMRLEASVDSARAEDDGGRATPTPPPAGTLAVAQAPAAQGVAAPAAVAVQAAGGLGQVAQQAAPATLSTVPAPQTAAVVVTPPAYVDPRAQWGALPAPTVADQDRSPRSRRAGTQDPPPLDDAVQFPSLREASSMIGKKRGGGHDPASPSPSPRAPLLQQPSPPHGGPAAVPLQAAPQPLSGPAGSALGAGVSEQDHDSSPAISAQGPPPQQQGGRPKPMLVDYMPGHRRPQRDIHEGSPQQQQQQQQPQQYGGGPPQGEEEQPSRVLWVGNVGANVTQQALQEVFGAYGQIDGIKMLPAKICAFVNFRTLESAARAREALHGHVLCGQPIRVKFRKRQELPPGPSGSGEDSHGAHQETLNAVSRAVWVGNVGEDVDETEFRRVASEFGEIESVKFLRAKMCAFVNYMTEAQAVCAVRGLSGQRIGGAVVRANFGKPLASPTHQMSQNGGMQMHGMPGSQGGYYPYAMAQQARNAQMQQYAAMQQQQQQPMPFFVWDGSAGHGGAYPGIPMMPGQAPFLFPAPPELCNVCYAIPQAKMLYPCGHGICEGCLQRARSSRSLTCPVCNVVVSSMADHAPGAMPYVGIPLWCLPSSM